MKNFLRKLQATQDECLGNLKSRAEESSLGKVSGTIIRVAEGIDFEDWQEIRKNIKNHFSDQRRFKGDSGKVVIEKNFLLNSLELQKGFFVFRPLNDEGETYLKVNKGFFRSKPSDVPTWTSLLLLVFAAAILFGFIFSPYYFIGIISLPLMIWLDNLNGKWHKLAIDKWLGYFVNNPSGVLSKSICSGLGSKQDDYTHTTVKIDLSNSLFYDNYKSILNKTIDIAAKINGKIVWLWCYDEQIVDEFRVSYNDLGHLEIMINILSSNIMPAIETKSSFIFCLDNFSEEMDTYEEGILFIKLRDKIKDSLNGYYKDDLFKMVI
ncbi:MAG: hypothetical protein WCK59_02775 [Candidatus Falkowbacteria bacterium]